VFTFLQQSGGRLPESVVVPMILEPTMSALNYIHGLVSAGYCRPPRGFAHVALPLLLVCLSEPCVVSCAGAVGLPIVDDSVPELC
jgi:hypothetical protein